MTNPKKQNIAYPRTIIATTEEAVSVPSLAALPSKIESDIPQRLPQRRDFLRTFSPSSFFVVLAMTHTTRPPVILPTGTATKRRSRVVQEWTITIQILKIPAVHRRVPIRSPERSLLLPKTVPNKIPPIRPNSSIMTRRASLLLKSYEKKRTVTIYAMLQALASVIPRATLRIIPPARASMVNPRKSQAVIDKNSVVFMIKE